MSSGFFEEGTIIKYSRLPRIDGSLDRHHRATHGRPRGQSLGRADTDRLAYDQVDNFVRPMMRNKFGSTTPTPISTPLTTTNTSSTLPSKPRFNTDVKALIRTYKKVAYL